MGWGPCSLPWSCGPLWFPLCFSRYSSNFLSRFLPRKGMLGLFYLFLSNSSLYLCLYSGSLLILFSRLPIMPLKSLWQSLILRCLKIRFMTLGKQISFSQPTVRTGQQLCSSMHFYFSFLVILWVYLGLFPLSFLESAPGLKTQLEALCSFWIKWELSFRLSYFCVSGFSLSDP